MPEFEYTTLDLPEKLRLALDQLHGKETDHFRLSLVPENATPGQIESIEEQIVRLREDVEQLQAQVAEVLPTPTGPTESEAEEPKPKPES